MSSGVRTRDVVSQVGQGGAPSWGLRVAGHQAGGRCSPRADQGPSSPLADDAFGEEPRGTAAGRGRHLRGFLPDARGIGPGPQVSDWARQGQLRAVVQRASAPRGPALALPRAERSGPSG